MMMRVSPVPGSAVRLNLRCCGFEWVLRPSVAGADARDAGRPGSVMADAILWIV